VSGPNGGYSTDQLVYDIQFGAIHAATSATVGTVINGGNYAENLGSAFQSAAIGVLGKQAALKLGQAYRDGDLNYVTHKIAHAALGGALAAGTGGDAVSGAIGGVVGEIAAEELTARFLQSQLENPESLRNLTLEKQAELRADTEQLRELGVDFSKLAAGVAAALAGRDVNDAAGSAENAARNNAVMVLPIMLELIDKGLQTYDAYRLAQAWEAGDTEQFEEILEEIALGAAVDAIPGSVIAVKVGLALKKFGIVGLGAKIVGKYGDDAAGRVAKLAPAESPIWQEFKNFQGKTKTNGLSGKKERFYEWDYTHGDIEVYDRNGKHLGSMDPISGEMKKPPVVGREK
jgi:filamentous hemagglutinin